MNYELFTTERGLEPAPRTRAQSTDVIHYRLTQDDVERIPGFVFNTLAQSLFGDASFAWILRDVNDEPKDEFDYLVGDIVVIPRDWQQIARVSKVNQPQTDRRRRSYL